MATVKKLSETSYEVSVTRTGDELSHLKEHVLSHFKDAKVDGFRPGHVPAKVLEQKFQKEILMKWKLLLMSLLKAMRM